MRRKLSRRRSSKGSEDGGSVQEDAASAPARPPAAPGATVVQTSGPIDYEVRFGVGLLGMTLARRGGSVIVNELPHAKHLADPRSGASNIQKGDAVVVVNGHPIEFPSSITMVEEKFRHAQAAGKPYLVKFRRSHSSERGDSLGDSSQQRVTTLKRYRVQTMRDYNIMVEFKALRDTAPGGVYLLPSANDMRLFYGVIFIRLGIYKGGIFKFKLELPRGYPSDGALPRVCFFSKIYHPLVDITSGTLDLSPEFPSWKVGKHYLVMVLRYVKRIFYLKRNFYQGMQSALNPQALQAYLSEPDTFQQRASDSVTASIERRFLNERGSSLRFTSSNPTAVARIRDHILHSLISEGSGEAED